MKSTVWVRFAIAVLVFFIPCLLIGINTVSAQVVNFWDFDDLNDPWGGWLATNGVWDVGVPTTGPSAAHSPPNCAGTNLDGNYPRYTDSQFKSPTVLLPNIVAGQEEIVLTYWQWFYYNNEPWTTDDRGVVEIYYKDNSTWVKDEKRTAIYRSPLWSFGQVDLTGYAGKEIVVSFHHKDYYDSSGGESHGWFIDDVMIEKRSIVLFNQYKVEDFENGWSGWWASNGVWQIGEPTYGPTAYSPVNCAGTNLHGKYFRYTSSNFFSPPIDLEEGYSQIQVRFKHWFSFFNEPWTTDDRGELRVQVFESGAWSSWITKQTYTYSSGGWTEGGSDLTEYAGKRVRIGFRIIDYYDSSGGESSGWYIDDVKMYYMPGLLIPPDPEVLANGQMGPVTVTSSDTVQITASLDKGNMPIGVCEWWVGCFSSFGTFWYTNNGGKLKWVLSQVPVPLCYSQPLSFAPVSLYNYPLPEGVFYFFFILDDNPDGVLDYSWGDLVTVAVSDGKGGAP